MEVKMFLDILGSVTHSPVFLILGGIAVGASLVKVGKWAYHSNMTVYNHGNK
jgi:hypothetical protein